MPIRKWTHRNTDAFTDDDLEVLNIVQHSLEHRLAATDPDCDEDEGLRHSIAKAISAAWYPGIRNNPAELEEIARFKLGR